MNTDKLARLISSGLLVALSALSAGAQVASATPAVANVAASSTAVLPVSNFAVETPPNLPQVSCSGHQLTIFTDNSMMSSVFAALHRCLGVSVDSPDGSPGGRIFARFGPGPARQVLESLLSSTDYNFIIQSSDVDPDIIKRVLLMSRSNDTKDAEPGSDLTLTPARRAWLQSRRNLRPAEISDDAQANEVQPISNLSAERSELSSSETSTVIPIVPVKPSTESANAGAEDVAPSASKSAVTTADATPAATRDTAATTTNASQEMQQKITSMQQMFDQRKQMIQSQNASPKPQ